MTIKYDFSQWSTDAIVKHKQEINEECNKMNSFLALVIRMFCNQAINNELSIRRTWAE